MIFPKRVYIFGIFEYLRKFIKQQIFSTPRGIRIPVTSVKGKCPRPLDDGGKDLYIHNVIYVIKTCQWVSKK